MTNEEILCKLRQDIRLRGLSSATEEEYLMAANTFIKFYDNQPIFNMTEQEIRNYLIYLLEVKKLSPASINNRNSGLRFLFGFTLERNLNYRAIPRQKIVRKLPDIMTVQEIQSLFDSCGNLRDKAILMTIYGGGLRLSEVCHLRGQDIYASSMRIKVCHGKGGKDRFTLLSQKNLEVLTEYWYAYKPKHPDGYLFLTKQGNPMSWRTVQDLFHKARAKAGITKHVSVHTLRHDFATHLLQSGTDVCRIKQLLGHTHIQSTTFYLHLLDFDDDLVSPLDFMESKKKCGRPKGSKNNKTSGGNTNA